LTASKASLDRATLSLAIADRLGWDNGWEELFNTQKCQGGRKVFWFIARSASRLVRFVLPELGLGLGL